MAVNPVTVNTEWLNSKSQHSYIIIGTPLIKINDEWIDGIVYSPADDCTVSYARTTSDFLDKFTFVRFLNG